MYCCQKGCRILGVSSGNTTPLLQLEKGILDKMPQRIEIVVILPLLLSILFGRNHYLHTSIPCHIDNFVAVIAFIRNQIVRVYPVNELASLSAIRCGTCCNKHSDRIAMRIHGQVYL